jgi:hypothetical protein
MKTKSQQQKNKKQLFQQVAVNAQLCGGQHGSDPGLLEDRFCSSFPPYFVSHRLVLERGK